MKRENRGLSAQEARIKKKKKPAKDSHLIITSPHQPQYKSLLKMTRSPDIDFLSFMVHYTVPTNRGKTFGTTAITEGNHSRFALPGRYTKTNVSFSLPLSHLFSQVFLRFYQVMHFQIS